jgi:chromosome segregation ATPase
MAQDISQVQFFSRKYTNAVDKIERLVADHASAKEKWETERSDLQAAKLELEERLRHMDYQLRLMKDKTKGDIERCTAAEQALLEARRERDAERQKAELQEDMFSRLRMQVRAEKARNKELQGNIDLLQGSASVPFPSFSSQQELLRKHAVLEEANTKLLNDLARHAKEWSERHKKLDQERRDAVAEAATLRERVAELEKQILTSAKSTSDGSGGGCSDASCQS